MCFSLLTNCTAPVCRVRSLPFFQLYSSVGLMDTYIAVALAHCLFNVLWQSGFWKVLCPAFLKKSMKPRLRWLQFLRFFITIYIPLIRAGVGVTAFFCFMFSWVELLIARTLTVTNAKPISAIMTRTISATGLDYGLLAAAGILTIVPGALVIWFARNHMAKGFALGRV